MKRSEFTQIILHHHMPTEPQQTRATAFAPINIALSKYWGKRNSELNLPVTSSLSITIPTKGSKTTLVWTSQQTQDSIVFNGEEIDRHSVLAQGITQFFDLFRPTHRWHLHTIIETNIALAAGFASSASGFAALALAMNDLFAWRLELSTLSMLARLGSGSATRSLWTGFVEWHCGQRDDGMDSYAAPLLEHWPEFCVGLLDIRTTEKPISSRKAMQDTMNTTSLYSCWPEKATHDIRLLKHAIDQKDFSLLGSVAEQNALTMHAIMLSSWPPICYFLPDTIAAIQRVWALRQTGLDLYFTQDAGPNLVLLFLKKDANTVKQSFPNVEIVSIFDDRIKP